MENNCICLKHYKFNLKKGTETEENRNRMQKCKKKNI